MDRIIKRGDIYYAELNPVIGSEQGSTRPVLIISNNTGNRLSPTVIITAITSRSKTRKSKLAHMGNSTGIQMKQSADFARSWLNLPEDYCFLEEDKGLSGYYADRPDFQRMLHDIEAGKIRAVV